MKYTPTQYGEAIVSLLEEKQSGERKQTLLRGFAETIARHKALKLLPKIESVLEVKLGKKDATLKKITTEDNPHLIAGAVVEQGGNRVDSSIGRRLKELRSVLTK
ncbi:MAG: hypothetical protein A2836_00065 [Candidatus Taylorbacteria bacterium RIFCSPHIGHO2_01_FULL_45_63]|uniref:Uncharacterized protein n=1 Tax=Candidatus Taylorbacteria bacterium RIFCSPHIGHO2_02_FULL_45_35 TaxID=1802311 RepID=A0A1G2MTL5_9BACT|nr:MAG: hypothetical protein A2836_00065 [Candidatus Taylorbacteria bacterium RIFCSPHIGHO2_01_FULL_45_63]OHA27206.1 MAG: hypothetical protein A3D56_01990 [Candidatus Taylorbacteria bacterium RIFCSPHIGHO2_02_FULL_45_35]OHA33700.1 MAG: hypothetical protein A3A22_03925 [Candidatus Taylorbacteria bacterium RIFCSPLOWO2_01_FULL_45_34b]